MRECSPVRATWSKPRPPKSQERQGLSDLSRAIEAIKDEVAELRRRLQVPELDLRAAELYRSCLEVLQAKVKEGEAKFRRDVKGTTLEHAYQLCQSIPGVGEKTARVLVCELPEDLAERSAAQIASYAGVAPLDDSSGTRVRAKLSRGNHRLKKTLFMPALVCMRTQAWGKDLYARLRAKGKSHQTCMVAIMRRLLIRIVSVLKRGSPWSCEPLAT